MVPFGEDPVRATLFSLLCFHEVCRKAIVSAAVSWSDVVGMTSVVQRLREMHE